jgi:hypothetical protein
LRQGHVSAVPVKTFFTLQLTADKLQLDNLIKINKKKEIQFWGLGLRFSTRKVTVDAKQLHMGTRHLRGFMYLCLPFV